MSQYNYVWLNSFFYIQHKKIDRFCKLFVLRHFSRPIFSWKLRFIKSQILNIKEIASIYHFPHGRFNKNPRIKRQNFKIVPAPDSIPSEWILLWHNLYSGVKKEIRMKPEDRFRHFYVVGQTGTGKSSMLLVQAKQDVEAWRWFALIDPHGDLCEQLLEHFPKERVDDLIYFDAGETSMPLGMNLLEADTPEEKEMIVSDMVDMFVMMYGPEIFGPRIQDYFRNWIITLMDQPEGWTLVEIVRLFTDEKFQKMKVRNVTDPSIRTWWQKTYDGMGDREKKEMIPYFQAKFGPLTTTPLIRNIIWQVESSFNVFDAMQSNKVLLLNLSKWKMGEVNSQMLWTMMVTRIKAAALRRAIMPEDERNPYFLYIDEFQNYITPSIETILSEARKYRLGLIIAHQYIEQLVQKKLWGQTDLRWPVFGNIWTQMAYKVGAPDAEFLEKEYAPEFSAADMVNMDRFKWVLKLSVDTQPSRPFSINVLNPYTKALNEKEKIDIIKKISRLKWWRPKDKVEEEINYRVLA